MKGFYLIQNSGKCLLILLFLFSTRAFSQASDDTLDASKLSQLTLEELMNIRVTTVSMRPEKQIEVGGALQVITDVDIHRYASVRLPEVLRLASNLQIQQANSHDWAITARGFNGLPSAGGIFSNKLQVVMDGRSLYNPLFGGVYWDVQNTLLQDVDRIEVLGGPGATFWGLNAVNGVINIVTKSAKETQGLYASLAGGSFLNNYEGLRVGSRSKVDTNLYFRIYAQHFSQGSTSLDDGTDGKDSWDFTQGGFRMDYYPTSKTSFTLKGEVYEGEQNIDSLIRYTVTDGQNINSSFTHSFSDESELRVLMYFDRTWRTTPNSLSPFFYRLYSYETNIQHSFSINERNHLMYGAGFRLRSDKVPQGLDPLKRDMPMYSLFVQEMIDLSSSLKFVVGTKLLNNDFTGFEYQPSIRLGWSPNEKNTVWTSASRAVRIPSRFDSDYLVGSKRFDSEKLISYQLGYRVSAALKSVFSFATFFNNYNDLRSIDSTGDPLNPLIISNNQKAQSWGLEFYGIVQPGEKWRLRGGYTYFNRSIWALKETVAPISEEVESVDPKNIFLIQSLLDIGKKWSFDITGRFSGKLPATTTFPEVTSYFTMDARLAWQIKQFEIAVSGRNLLQDKHIEVGRVQIPRSVSVLFTCQF